MKSIKENILFVIRKVPNKFVLFWLLIGLFFLSLFSYIQPKLLGKSIDMIIKNDSYSFYRSVMVILLLCIVKYVISIFIKYKFIILSQNFNEKLRIEMLSKAIDIEMEYYGSHERGYIQSRINEAGILSALFSPSTLTIIIGFLDFIISAVAMGLLDIKMSMLLFAMMPIYYFLIKRHASRLKEYSHQSMEKNALLSSDIFSVINDIETIKVTNDKERRISKFSKSFDGLKKILILQGKSVSSYFENAQMLNYMAVVIVLVLSGYKIFSGEFTLGDYTAYAAYSNRFFSSVLSFASIGITLTPLFVGVERTKDFLNTMEENDNRTIKLNNEIYSISVENLSFSYRQNSEKNVLKNINFDWKKGEKIWLRGVNGSGKSTLIKILLGLYPVESGDVLINKISINRIQRESLRKAYSVMLQNSTVFPGSLLENLLYYTGGDNVSKIEGLMHKYGIMNYFNNLKDGLCTELSDKSGNISGGQSQIILFLRTVLSDNKVVIMDEPTSNMDQELKHTAMKILKEYGDEKLVILISHDHLIESDIVEMGFRKEEIVN